jgi:hypothetical protein
VYYGRCVLEMWIADQEQQQAAEAWLGDTPGWVIG